MNGLIEMAYEIGVIGGFQNILRKLSDIQIVSDKVIDFGNFSTGDFISYFKIPLPTIYGFTPDFGRQGIILRCSCVPLLSAFEQFRLLGVEADSNILRDIQIFNFFRIVTAGCFADSLFNRVIDIRVSAIFQKCPKIAISFKCLRIFTLYLIKQKGMMVFLPI
ncbi:MAG: hypothetical protein MRK02_11405 [Candidatus Scalindua sp.]|nr:hypothetical protein [Candidatus Scalindua sp.]